MKWDRQERGIKSSHLGNPAHLPVPTHLIWTVSTDNIVDTELMKAKRNETWGINKLLSWNKTFWKKVELVTVFCSHSTERNWHLLFLIRIKELLFFIVFIVLLRNIRWLLSSVCFIFQNFDIWILFCGCCCCCFSFTIFVSLFWISLFPIS